MLWGFVWVVGVDCNRVRVRCHYDDVVVVVRWVVLKAVSVLGGGRNLRCVEHCQVLRRVTHGLRAMIVVDALIADSEVCELENVPRFEVAIAERISGA